MGDFSKKQPAPEGRGKQSRAADEQGGAPTTGFVQAPKSGAKGDGGPGPAVPANTRKIR